MSDTRFLQYTTEYISGVMSLRTPQEDSLKKLAAIMSEVDLSKNRKLDEKLSDINAMYPICTDFERNFPSITFALATGVGKTRLMGAFIHICIQYMVLEFFSLLHQGQLFMTNCRKI